MNFFASNLVFLLAERRLTYAQLAATLNIQSESLMEMEEGTTEPSLDELVAIAQALEIPIETLLTKNLSERNRRYRELDIRLLLMDVDGTLTEGGMYYTESGDQFKKFNVQDGIAISRVARRTPLEFGIITAASRFAAAQARAQDLHIRHFYGGNEPKVKVAERWLDQLGLGFEQVAYIGDDLNDLDLLKRVGFSACPADACVQVREAAQVVLSRKGGEGCVRELLEEVLGYDIEGLAAK